MSDDSIEKVEAEMRAITSTLVFTQQVTEWADRLAAISPDCDLIRKRMEYATEQHAKLMVENADLTRRLAKLEAVLRRIASSEFDSVPDNARALRKAGQQLTKEAKSALGEGE